MIHSGENKVMKIIKDINKLIIIKYLEIVFVLVFLFFSIFLWKARYSKEFFSSEFAFSNLNYTHLSIENPINYAMYPMHNEKALQNLKPCFITVINDTYTEESYLLTLKIDKSSTLDYQYLNLSIADNIYPLNTLERIEEKNNWYFILDQYVLKSEQKTYEIRLWIDARGGNELQSKDLIMGFELMNGVTKM